MSLANLSIKRPIFITCLVILILFAGGYALNRLPVDLFPDVNFPIVTVTTVYPGSGPREIETLVSKPIEDELVTISGIKRVTSQNVEGVSQVVAQFFLETNIQYAEQQVRDRVAAVRGKLPDDAEDSVIRRIDPADLPIVTIALNADLGEAEMFDLADDFVRPRLEQVDRVGLVEVLGGRKREIRVTLDRAKLKRREMPVMGIAAALGRAGENIPSGKVTEGKAETIIRTVGQFENNEDIRNIVVNLYGNDVPTRVADLGEVTDGLADEKTRTFVGGKKSILLDVYRQSGSNTVAVANSIKAKAEKLQKELDGQPGNPKLTLVRDASWWIGVNVQDVKESIFFGIILTIIVVYFFLASGRSTIITGLALPNSLLGAFILMALAGFSVNIVTMLALSLSVGLLIDDAIVVRENIFRHIEMGKDPITAAQEGTAEVQLAVIATTLCVMAVFGPVAFMSGMIGQFMRQFGLTIIFAMAISLFDALTMAPMLSAYFAGASHGPNMDSPWGKTVGRLVLAFVKFQDWLEAQYEGVLRFTLRRPLMVLFFSFLTFLGLMATVVGIPKGFFPEQDQGEFSITLDMAPGTSLDTMAEMAQKVDEVIRAEKFTRVSALTIGGRNGEPNKASFYINMIPAAQRGGMTTGQFKELLRGKLTPFAEANPLVKEFDAIGAGANRQFMLNILGYDQEKLEAVAKQIFELAKANKKLKGPDSTYRPGQAEFQLKLVPELAQTYGINSRTYGMELRAQVEGVVAAKFRKTGKEYDVRVRLQDDQRNLRESFSQVYVPNVNNRMVRLSDVAKGEVATGPSAINRQDRARFIQINADLAAGAGLGDAMSDMNKAIAEKVQLPEGVRLVYVGSSEDFQDFGRSITLAIAAAILIIFLVLSSLYESFVTPFTIMLALPLAFCGAFGALFITGESINLFSMIGVILLLGVASKNGILLVDQAMQLIREGQDRTTALINAGKNRLRPILMTTMALIAGTLPIALGLNEASKSRTSMGVAIIGGLITSTLLTLIVVPAAFSYIDRFRLWSKAFLSKWLRPKDPTPHGGPGKKGPQDRHEPVIAKH
jgi:hydrophobic/amphiphilic exporter-1 (mainly G- bacteria), HAE1 family